MKIKTEKKNLKLFPNYRISPLNAGNFTYQLQGALLKTRSSRKNPKLWPKTASEILVFTLVRNPTFHFNSGLEVFMEQRECSKVIKELTNENPNQSTGQAAWYGYPVTLQM